MSITSVLEAGAGRLGIRFFLVGVLPTAGFALFVAALRWSGAPDRRPDLDRVADSIADLGAGEGLVALTAVLVAALLLEPFQLAMVRALEGYWGESRPAGLVARPLRAAHERRRDGLKARVTTTADPSELSASEQAARIAAGRRLRQRYPVAGPLQPTAFGNAMRAAEERAGDPYGLDAVVVWPRLYPLLGERLAAGVDGQRNEVDLAARLVWVLGAATVVALALLISHGWWLLVPAATALLAAFAYRGATATAVGYGLLLQVAFELHRFDLLAALHCPLPQSAAQEHELNRTVSKRLLHGNWDGFDYRH